MRAGLSARAGLGWAILVFLATPAVSQSAPDEAPAPAKAVGTIEIEQESVPFTVVVPGRAVAFEQADIRPRVEGMVVEIPYPPGSEVAVGDVLFRIERDSYAAEATAAEAEVSQAESAVQAAQVTLERYQRLEGSGVTQETVDTARVAELQAEAALKSAQAALQTAQLNLDRTEIRSPIAGIADVPAISIGALVTAGQAEALTTVTRLDPIYVDVAESSARMLRVRERIEQGSLRPGDQVQMTLTLVNGGIYGATGEIVSPGVLVSETTGTFNIRVRFPNPNHDIMPGQFLRIEATLGTTDGILVPQRATSRSSTGVLTAFVVRDGTAAQVTLTEAGTDGNAWIVTDGLEPGDQLIVDGLRNLRNGDAVEPLRVRIDEDGLTQPIAAAQAANARAATAPAANAPAGQTPTQGN